jgi:hypothetical protein
VTSSEETLLQRWGVSPTASVWVGGNNLDARREVEAVVSSLRASPDQPIDCAFITPTVVEEASYFAAKLSSRFVSGATVWIAWPYLDHEGLAAVVSGLGGVGFEEVDRVTLSDDIVTVGFRKKGQTGLS